MNVRTKSSTHSPTRTAWLILACGAFACRVVAQDLGTFAIGGSNVVQNGSFETTGSFGFPIYWTPVNTLLNWGNAPDGFNYVQNGAVSQTLSTSPGQSYILSFYGAGDLYFSTTSTVEVDLGGQPVGTFTTQAHPYNPQMNRFSQIVWERFSIVVQPSASSPSLTFQTLNNTGLLLDNVSMLPVPEPSNLLLVFLGVGAFLLRRRWWHG